MAGSSPLTRGRRQGIHHRSKHRRLIPAHAGSTRDLAGSARANSAHPRSRGVDPLLSYWFRCRAGSSPLTRGRLARTPSRTARTRLIPAHAGSTVIQNIITTVLPAHPRSRGVDFEWSCDSEADGGSSPLTRGRPQKPPTPPPEARLIPAHAGSTVVSALGEALVPAHPRSRGVDVPGQEGHGVLGRLIPAHAGSTTGDEWALSSTSAHPRSRGVDQGRLSYQAVEPGSSPLTRGRRFTKVADCSMPRLIPAHAGSTRRVRPIARCAAAHPRSRGVDLVCLASAAEPLGSSPLTRGRRPPDSGPGPAGSAHPRSRGVDCTPPDCPRAPRRLIPAHAGSTL